MLTEKECTSFFVLRLCPAVQPFSLSHSTGRGGRANLTNLHSPPLEASSPHPHDYETTGRGGVGNMVRSRSGSREPRSRSASRGGSRDRASSLARILNKVGLHSQREEDSEHPPSVAEGTGPTEIHE